eukprot:6195363-Pleurochrysis_carterae.AAC.4
MSWAPPPPSVAQLSTQSAVSPCRLRKAAMPSGRESGPENRMSTRDDDEGLHRPRCGTRCGAERAASAAEGEGCVRPGGWLLSSWDGCASAASAGPGGSQGKDCSLKYTSDAMTMRLADGTQML